MHTSIQGRNCATVAMTACNHAEKYGESQISVVGKKKRLCTKHGTQRTWDTFPLWIFFTHPSPSHTFKFMIDAAEWFVTEHRGTQVDDAMATWNGCGVRIKSWCDGDIYVQFSTDQITSSTSHIWFVSFCININYINHVHGRIVMKNWVSPFADDCVMSTGTRFK